MRKKAEPPSLTLREYAERAAVEAFGTVGGVKHDFTWMADRPFYWRPEMAELLAGTLSIRDFVVLLLDAELIDFIEYMDYDIGHADGKYEGEEAGYKEGFRDGFNVTKRRNGKGGKDLGD